MTSDLALQMKDYRLTTAEILYRLPDHPSLLQSYIWQEYDLALLGQGSECLLDRSAQSRTCRRPIPLALIEYPTFLGARIRPIGRRAGRLLIESVAARPVTCETTRQDKQKTRATAGHDNLQPLHTQHSRTP